MPCGQSTGVEQCLTTSRSTASPDRDHINLSENYELRYWTEKVNVTKEQLAVAIGKVGNSPDAVCKALER
jgi:hypothetical protein